MVQSTGLVVRHTSYGNSWYRIKYSVAHQGIERFYEDRVGFVQANDVEEAVRVLRECLEVERQEATAISKKSASKLEIAIISAVRSDAEIFISKNTEES